MSDPSTLIDFLLQLSRATRKPGPLDADGLADSFGGPSGLHLFVHRLGYTNFYIWIDGRPSQWVQGALHYGTMRGLSSLRQAIHANCNVDSLAPRSFAVIDRIRCSSDRASPTELRLFGNPRLEWKPI